MDATNRDRCLTQFQEKANSILKGKAQDYSNEDVLSSFKETAKVSGVTPIRVALVFIGTKLARLRNLLDNQMKQANFESIEDTVVDMYNYTFLLHLLIKEEQYELKSIRGTEPTES